MTEKRAAKKLLLFVTGFYIAVSVLAVAILNLSGSIFAKRGEVNLFEYFTGFKSGNEKLVEESIDEIDPESKIEGLEALDDAEEEISEAATETATEAYEEPSSEVYEEPSTEASEEPVSEEAPVEEEHFYSFKSNNTDTILRMREEPSEDSKVIYELKPGSSGYVVELGDDWSKVSAYGHEGYCANEFLTMTEVTESEYDELKDESDNAKPAGSGTSSQQTAAADPTVPVTPADTSAQQTMDTAAQQTATDPVASQPSADPAVTQQAGDTAVATGTDIAQPSEDP